jgi:hypothetical protein
MMTTLDFTGLKPEVVKAIESLQQHFEPIEFQLEADGAGGARVRFSPVALGFGYEQTESWIGAHIPPLIPYADIYPIFLRGDLRRKDGATFVAPMTQGHTFMGQAATQVSRASHRRDAAVETVRMKLLKVLHWVNSQ